MKKIIFLLFLIISESAYTQNPPPAPEPSVIPTPSPTPPQAQPPTEPKKKYLHGSLFGYANSGNQITFNTVTVSGNGQTSAGSAIFNTDTAAGVGIELWHSEPNKWGWNSGITQDSKRNVNSAVTSFNGQSTTTTYTGTRPTISPTIFYGNAIYRWEDFYLLFGLNLSSPNFVDGSGAQGTTTAAGGLGAQAGIGYRFIDHFSIELLSRATTYTISGATGSYTVNFGTGVMPSAQLEFKFDF